MAELLFEIGTEELPSWYVVRGEAGLLDLLGSRLAAVELVPESVTVYVTPRRLAAWVRGLPDSTPERVEERRGPPANVAFTAEGELTKAATAFAAKNGVAASELVRSDDERGNYVYAKVHVGGRRTAELLPDLLAGVVRDLPAPRKMRWGDEPTPFIRPIAWLVALLDGEVVDVEVAGVRASNRSRGHRFLAPEEFEVRGGEGYEEELARRFVIADRAKRRAATWEAVRAAAGSAGFTADDAPALLDEVTDLVESPFAILGAFGDEFLELPEEVLATVMIKHQRFFPTRAAGGAFAPAFVGVANVRVPDEAVVRSGYEQVLAGRLYDARFFWRSDRRKSLSQHAWGLSGIAFQKELGSMADKTARVGVSARLLMDALGIGDDEAEAAKQALPIFRADLATEMVFEFPELEGVMARAYALAEGLPSATAEALYDGVRPKTHEDGVPVTAAGAVLSVADKLDKLVGFFALGKRPSGSADPFALRRDGLAIVRVLAERGWPLPVATVVEAAAAAYADGPVSVDIETQGAVVEFLWDRVASLLTDRGASVPVVRAAVLGSATVVGAARRALLLEALLEREEMPDLLALYKRAANLARSEAGGGAAATQAGAPAGQAVKPELFQEEAEPRLLAALPGALEGVQALLGAAKEQLPGWDIRDAAPVALSGLEGGTQAVVSLKAPLDDFLDSVHVLSDDLDVRRNRLELLGEVVRILRQLGSLEQLAAG